MHRGLLLFLALLWVAGVCLAGVTVKRGPGGGGSTTIDDSIVAELSAATQPFSWPSDITDTIYVSNSVDGAIPYLEVASPDGSFTAPYSTLALAEAAVTNCGTRIYVDAGDEWVNDSISGGFTVASGLCTSLSQTAVIFGPYPAEAPVTFNWIRKLDSGNYARTMTTSAATTGSVTVGSALFAVDELIGSYVCFEDGDAVAAQPTQSGGTEGCHLIDDNDTTSFTISDTFLVDPDTSGAAHFSIMTPMGFSGGKWFGFQHNGQDNGTSVWYNMRNIGFWGDYYFWQRTKWGDSSSPYDSSNFYTYGQFFDQCIYPSGGSVRLFHINAGVDGIVHAFNTKIDRCAVVGMGSSAQSVVIGWNQVLRADITPSDVAFITTTGQDTLFINIYLAAENTSYGSTGLTPLFQYDVDTDANAQENNSHRYLYRATLQGSGVETNVEGIDGDNQTNGSINDSDGAFTFRFQQSMIRDVGFSIVWRGENAADCSAGTRGSANDLFYLRNVSFARPIGSGGRILSQSNTGDDCFLYDIADSAWNTATNTGLGTNSFDTGSPSATDVLSTAQGQIGPAKTVKSDCVGGDCTNAGFFSGDSQTANAIAHSIPSRLWLKAWETSANRVLAAVNLEARQ